MKHIVRLRPVFTRRDMIYKTKLLIPFNHKIILILLESNRFPVKVDILETFSKYWPWFISRFIAWKRYQAAMT